MFQFHITDRLLVSILFVVMAVFSTVMVFNLRENTSQTAKLRQSVALNHVLSEAGIICTLDTSGAVNTGKIPYTTEAIEQYVNECITKEAAQRHINLSPDTVTTIVTVPVTIPIPVPAS